ncbi:MAG: 50S ribosomal protein L25/general stress protein Ctc [Alphaproteobacteria bacterium]
MAEIFTLGAVPRDRAGKGAARAVRRAGKVPSVVYGAKKDPRMIAIDPLELRMSMERGSFFSTVFDIKIDGGDTERVLPRDIQLHPVTDVPQHVDFLRVSAATKVTVEVPCNFLNEEECPGLRRGGVLNVVRYDIEVQCAVDAIPASFDIDLTGLDIGDSIHFSHVTVPEGVEPTITDRDFTIATIAAPNVETEEDAEDEGDEDDDAEEKADAEED